jgi:tetratricopeptide (TPR) repeat protein
MGRHASIFIIIAAVVLGATVHSFAQTAQDAVRLYKEGQELYNKAASRGDMEKALQKFEQALSIFQRVGQKKGEAACLNNIGLVYRSWGQYAKALEYYEKSLAITRKIGDVKGEGVTLNNIGLGVLLLGPVRQGVGIL